MFEFTVPDGDWDHDGERYIFKDLVFTESTKKAAVKVIKGYVLDGAPFTMAFVAE